MKTFFLSDIKRIQPTENVGTIGHVSHGKSSIVKAIADKFTPRHSLEKERNITIDLGYANTRIYFSTEKNAFVSSTEHLEDASVFQFKNHISFVDCPGHNNFIATMCGGTRAFNAALVVISANDPIPQSQTLRHVEILKYTDITDILIVLNKVDLLKSTSDIENRITELKRFIDGQPHLQNKPVVAVSAHKKINIDRIIRFLSSIHNQKIIDSVNEDDCLDVLRTFDVNPLGQKLDQMVGGVLGVSIKTGYVEVGNHVGIFPGYMKKKNEHEWEIMPIFTKITSLKSEKEFLDIAFPGGLKAMGLDCDPGLCKQNKLLGSNVFKLTQKNIKRFIDPTAYSTQLTIRILHIHTDCTIEPDSQITLILNSKSIRAKIRLILEDHAYVIKLECPVYVNRSIQIPLLVFHKGSLVVLGFATIIDSKNDVMITLPHNYDQYCSDLPIQSEPIRIIDDIETAPSSMDGDTLENLRDNIHTVLEKINAVRLNIHFPDLMIDYEPLKIIWMNFDEYIKMIDNIVEHTDFPPDTRVYALEKVMQSYIQYSFGLTNISDVVVFNNTIVVHIKTKRLKQKLDKVIKLFFKHYYLCNGCRKLSCVLVKVCLKPYKICSQCSDRNRIHDDWIKNITIV